MEVGEEGDYIPTANKQGTWRCQSGNQGNLGSGSHFCFSREFGILICPEECRGRWKLGSWFLEGQPKIALSRERCTPAHLPPIDRQADTHTHARTHARTRKTVTHRNQDPDFPQGNPSRTDSDLPSVSLLVLWPD